MTHPPERYLRELPPRRLGWLTQAALLFSDPVSQTGWALLALGSVFFWTTSVRSDLGGVVADQGAVWEDRAGTVLVADSTGTMEGLNQIWWYEHSFALNGRRYRGESFSVGKKFDAGQIVFIRYDANDPGNNFIIGLRRRQFGGQVNWLLLMPFFGLPLAIWPVRRNLKFIRLLKIGDFARGRFLGKRPTGRSRKQGATLLQEVQCDFEFGHNGAKYLATCRTYRPHLVQDEETEMVLFDRYEPTFNLVYDAVPYVPTIDENGRMLPLQGPGSWVLFLPVFVVVVNLVFYWL